MKFVILVHRWRQSYAEVYTKDTKNKKRFQSFTDIQKRQYFKKKKDKEKDITKQARKTVPLKMKVGFNASGLARNHRKEGMRLAHHSLSSLRQTWNATADVERS